MATDVWKLLDSARIESPNEGGTAVVFAYEALSKAVGDVVRSLEGDLHDALVRADEAERKAAAAEVFVMPVEDGQPGEIDVCDGHDGHSHHYVPTSVWEYEHLHVRLLGQALGLMLHKAGVTNPGMALTGPQLLLAAESYLGVRVEVSADG